MSHAPIRGIRACVFDAYGTLFDVAAAARGCGGELGEKSGALSSLWREKQLQYTRLKQAGMRTAILSNGSPQMLKAAVQGAQINHLLDAVLSVEEVGIYKPHPK